MILCSVNIEISASAERCMAYVFNAYNIFVHYKLEVILYLSDK